MIILHNFVGRVECSDNRQLTIYGNTYWILQNLTDLWVIYTENLYDNLSIRYGISFSVFAKRYCYANLST